MECFTKKYQALSDQLDRVLTQSVSMDCPELIAMGEWFAAGARLKLMNQAELPTRPNPLAPEERLLDVSEVASMIGMSGSWVEKHVKDLPHRVSVIGNPRWKKSDVEKWMKNLPTYGKSS